MKVVGEFIDPKTNALIHIIPREDETDDAARTRVAEAHGVPIDAVKAHTEPAHTAMKEAAEGKKKKEVKPPRTDPKSMQAAYAEQLKSEPPAPTPAAREPSTHYEGWFKR